MTDLPTLFDWRLAAVLAGSFGICAILVLTQRWHGSLSLDHDLNGAQKLHHAPVPRVGGIGLISGLMAGALAGIFLDGKDPMMFELLLCVVPVFSAGLVEDLTKRVSVRARLYTSFMSAAAAIWLLNAHLTRVDISGVDALMVIAPLSFAFTCFAVGGMTHAINIIDGLNGLAAGCVAIMLSGLALIAWQVGDLMVFKLSLLGVAALLGFLLLNFPFGRIFLGDGGAYLAGFWLAECGILLLYRNPGVSTWAVLLCCMYPFWETIFSIYRRNVLHRVSSGRPDMIHFHHLVFRLISKTMVGSLAPSWLKHCLATLSLWALTAAWAFIAVRAYNDTPVLLAGCLSFVLFYGISYRHIQRTSRSPIRRTETLFQPDPSAFNK